MHLPVLEHDYLGIALPSLHSSALNYADVPFCQVKQAQNCVKKDSSSSCAVYFFVLRRNTANVLSPLLSISNSTEQLSKASAWNASLLVAPYRILYQLLL